MVDYERKFPICKDTLDTVNSFSWFLMDAAWMIDMPTIAKIMAPIVLMSAIALTYLDKRRNVMFINMAIVFWILMNISWMAAELLLQEQLHFYSKIFFAFGLTSITAALIVSPNVKETFSHFRRFRKMRNI
jgi:hypothetical protein